MTSPQRSEGDRRLIVEVRWGPLAHHRAVLEPGGVLQVGRGEKVDLSIPHDEQLEPLHFELSWDGTTCGLKDLDSRRGVLLGGRFVERGSVPHGGWVRAGRTDFSVYFEAATPPRPPKQPESEQEKDFKERALASLRNAPGSLFALLDAARDERILELLRESVEEYRSLYEGPQGEVLAEVAPYLVRLPKDSRLLQSLVGEGWGRSWGVFLCCEQQSLKELSRHFRHFLMVQGPEGKPLYFRFYDPRVLGVFLSTCGAPDALRFFGPIRAFLLEGYEPGVMRRLRVHSEGVWDETWRLGEEIPTAQVSPQRQ
ncbi:DUF4123 domain-containing protein [Archangium violaceum]|uniref:DUF4123 domain-containing protein n=1 Tax=Archangium violaceum TaxID=83451 RepID=UPI002B31BD5C|nr:DUF4123 domain-containing protein [Archangium gephyra]